MANCCVYLDSSNKVVLRQCSTGTCPSIAGLTVAPFQVGDCSECEPYPSGPDGGGDAQVPIDPRQNLKLGAVAEFLDWMKEMARAEAVLAELKRRSLLTDPDIIRLAGTLRTAVEKVDASLKKVGKL